jgi:hypothetical protein
MTKKQKRLHLRKIANERFLTPRVPLAGVEVLFIPH